MANYIKLVQSQAELTAFKASESFITPNVTAIHNSLIVDYNPYVAPVGPTPHDYSQDYFTIEALTSGTFNFTNDNSEDGYLQYSLDDGETWSEEYGSIEDLSLNANDKLLIKGNITLDDGASDGNYVSYTGDFNVYGNIMSLVYGDNFANQTSLAGKDYIFAYLFSNNETLLSAENLILPATTLTDFCYFCMFHGCSSLTTAPELPATTLAESCYYGMFEDCISLNYIKCLATDISSEYCTGNWVSGVAANGTFTKADSMTDWTTGVDGIPSGWTVQDAS